MIENLFTKLAQKKASTLTCMVFICLLFLASCGESSSSGDDSISANKDLKADCEISEEKLNNFLEEEIPREIECLQENLELFVRVVRPDSPQTVGKLSQQALERFISKEKPSLKKVLKYTALFFNLSHLIFSEQYGYLSKENIPKLATVLKVINSEVARVYPILQKLPDQEVYSLHQQKRGLLIKAAAKISASMVGIFGPAMPLELQRPIAISDVLDIFEDEGNAASIVKIKALLFIKRMLAGGDAKTINQNELKELMSILPQVAHLAFDVLQFDAIIFSNESSRYQFFSDAIQTLEQTIAFENQPTAKLFEIADVEGALLAFKEDFGNNLKIESFFSVIPEFKAVFGMSPEKEFKRNDLTSILDHFKKIVRYGEAFSQIYYYVDLDRKIDNLRVMNSPGSIEEERIYLPNLEFEAEFNEFVRIAKSYRFFKGENLLPLYSDFYSRNLRGMIESVTMEYIFEKYANYYEENFPSDDPKLYHRPRIHYDPKTCPDKEDGQCIEILTKTEDHLMTLTQGQLEYIMVRLKDALFELDIVTPEREYSTAESAVLMTDLFQYQSNGNGVVDKFEAAELGTQIIGAIKMKDNLTHAFKELFSQQSSSECPVTETPEGKIKFGATCFRANFRNALYYQFDLPFLVDASGTVGQKETFSYGGDFMPRLMDALDDYSSEGLSNFIHKMEAFTRTCYIRDITAPIPSEDIVGIFGGLFNIESTLARFDVDPVDNVLKGEELETAFRHFRSAVIGIVRQDIKEGSIAGWVVDRFGINNIAQAAFYYMVQKKAMPKPLQLVGFMIDGLKFNYKQGAVADREVMASVLAGLRENSPNKPSKELLLKLCPLPSDKPPQGSVVDESKRESKHKSKRESKRDRKRLISKDGES